jgi:hypothetical protein
MTAFCFGVYIVHESMGRTVESSLEFTGLFLNMDRIPQYKGELHLGFQWSSFQEDTFLGTSHRVGRVLNFFS